MDAIDSNESIPLGYSRFIYCDIHASLDDLRGSVQGVGVKLQEEQARCPSLGQEFIAPHRNLAESPARVTYPRQGKIKASSR
jgi:hypothetical protein